jgi:hypothetical protein
MKGLFTSIILTTAIIGGIVFAQGRQLLAPVGELGAPGLAFETDKKSGVRMKDATTVAIDVNGIEAVTIGRSGILTGSSGLTGSGLTSDRIVRWDGSNIVNSLITDDGTDLSATAGVITMTASTGDLQLLSTLGYIQLQSLGYVEIISTNDDVQISSGGNLTLAEGSSSLSLHSPATGGAGWALGAVTFANLGTPTNGVIIYCSDCTEADPCAGSGTGALAKRINSVWVCN